MFLRAQLKQPDKILYNAKWREAFPNTFPRGLFSRWLNHIVEYSTVIKKLSKYIKVINKKHLM